MDVITFPENLLTTSGLSILLHGVISLPDTMSFYSFKVLPGPEGVLKNEEKTQAGSSFQCIALIWLQMKA